MTPEEIVGLIGNIANRQDIREIQERQIEEIYSLVKEFEDIAKEWRKGYLDLEIKHKVKVANLEQTIEELEKDFKDLKMDWDE